MWKAGSLWAAGWARRPARRSLAPVNASAACPGCERSGPSAKSARRSGSFGCSPFRSAVDRYSLEDRRLDSARRLRAGASQTKHAHSAGRGSIRRWFFPAVREALVRPGSNPLSRAHTRRPERCRFRRRGAQFLRVLEHRVRQAASTLRETDLSFVDSVCFPCYSSLSQLTPLRRDVGRGLRA